MVPYHFCNFASSAASTAFSQSVITWSSFFIVAFQLAASNLFSKVSSLLPSKLGGLIPLNCSSARWFQNIRCVANCPMEWLPLLSCHIACSAVTPSKAESAGTNHSFEVCVDFNCASKTLFSVGGGVIFCAVNVYTCKASKDAR